MLKQDSVDNFGEPVRLVVRSASIHELVYCNSFHAAWPIRFRSISVYKPCPFNSICNSWNSRFNSKSFGWNRKPIQSRFYWGRKWIDFDRDLYWLKYHADCRPELNWNVQWPCVQFKHFVFTQISKLDFKLHFGAFLKLYRWWRGLQKQLRMWAWPHTHQFNGFRCDCYSLRTVSIDKSEFKFELKSK